MLEIPGTILSMDIEISIDSTNMNELVFPGFLQCFLVEILKINHIHQ
jgi:hypothetical protein